MKDTPTLRKYRNYLLMFFLVGVSGMPCFTNSDLVLVGFAVALSSLLIWEKDLRIEKEFVIILATCLFLVFCQAIIFSFFKLITVLGMVITFSVGYFVVRLLKERFIDYFLDVMVFLTLFSFVVFIPVFLRPELERVIMDSLPSFLSYNYEFRGVGLSQKTLVLYHFNIVNRGNFGLIVRNCGPFWEAGAFGGYLILALLFNTIRTGKFLTGRNAIFLLGILTTQSTTAYIALFVILLIVYLIFRDYPVLFKFVMFVGLAFAITFAAKTIPFITAKIKIEAAGIKDSMASGGDTRLASTMLDWQDIKGFPFTGRGMWTETRVDKKFKTVIRNNGVTNLMARWGIFFFFIYFYWYHKSFKEYCRIYGANRFMPIAMVIIILLIGMSENYYESSFFLGLAFMYTPYRNTELYIVEYRDNYALSRPDEIGWSPAGNHIEDVVVPGQLNHGGYHSKE